MMNEILIGPFKQLLTMDGLAPEGPLKDGDLVILTDAGIITENGVIKKIGKFSEMKSEVLHVQELSFDAVAVPDSSMPTRTYAMRDRAQQTTPNA